jgi:flagellar hook protein FlgE
MSFQSLRTGVSGLNANQTRLDVISNNISNSGTVAFKRGRAAFSEVLGQEITSASGGPGGSSQIGRGASVDSINRNFQQGSLDQTGVKTDLALSGDGFFVTSPKDGSGGQQRQLTRAGNFTFNQDGALVTANGLNVQGYEVGESGSLKTGELKDIQFDPNAQSEAKFTSKAEVGGNLSADVKDGTKTSLSSVVYDQQGTSHDVVVEFTKDGTGNKWNYEVKTSGSDPLDLPNKSVDAYYNDANGNGSYDSGTESFVKDGNGNILTNDSAASPPSGAKTTAVDEGFLTDSAKIITDGSGSIVENGDNLPDETSATTIDSREGTIEFNTDGSIAAVDGNSDQSEVGVSWKTSAVAGGDDLSFDLSGLTQYSGSTTSKFQSQNGNPAGKLSDFSFTKEGKLQLNFNNGEQETVYQLAIGNVNNPDGLEQQGNNAFTTTNASGDLQLGRAGRDLQTSVESGTLESSNVELADAFAGLIEAQRSYQASSRVVTTADQVLQETVQLKR